MSTERWWPTLGLVLCFGCNSSPSTTRGFVEHAAPGRTWVVFGRAWVDPLQQGNIALVNASGGFQLPESANAATAFIDVNENGTSDGPSEPSGWCERSGSWHCRIPREQILVHKIGIVLPDGTVREQVTLAPSSFGSDWVPLPVTACTQEGQCTEEVVRSFTNLTTTVPILKNCQHDWSTPLIITTRAGEQSSSYEVEAPPPVNVSMTARQSDDGLVLRVKAEEVVDRLIVWYATVDDEGAPVEVFWNSETANTIRPGELEHMLTLENSILENCATNCAVGLQAVRLHRPQEAVTLVSEGRRVLLLETRTDER